MNILIIFLAILGFVISIYTYMLENKVKQEPEFKPYCDISDRISCTKPILSPYANLFYFSNAIVGAVYYLTVIILALFNAYNLIFVFTILACLVSLILAYLLYFKIKSLCILCTSLYIINFAILLLASKIQTLL